jgi:hypothetical protein
LATVEALATADAAIRILVLRIMRLFAAIQSKCLSMNHLHTKPRLFQSSSVKPDQA